MLNQFHFGTDCGFGSSWRIASLCGLAYMFAGGLSLSVAAQNFGVLSTDTDARVTIERDRNLIRINVDNSERSEVTLTFDFSPINLGSSVSFPYTATFKPGQTKAFTMSPIRPDDPWHYSYTNYFKLGSSDAVHDESVVYQLPYAPGRSYKVSQGYNSGFSHHGANQFAIDWKMPEGTEVRAARGGSVVKVKDDSNVGGRKIQFDPYNNFVIIRHEDGTLGQYCHLQKDGVKVTPGQAVRTGEAIALSGNTGFSGGAHLHFCVFKTMDGRQRITIPVKFEHIDNRAVTLIEGGQYRAAEIRVTKIASVRASNPTMLR